MPANTNPIFVLTPKVGMTQATVANTNRDGTGSLVIVLTGATNGTRIDKITVTATGNTTAGMVRFYLDDGAANIRMIMEISVTAVTVSASVQAFTQTVVFDHGLVVPYNWILKASTHNAETFNIFALAGEY
jgi:hypothetical protein